MFAINNYAFCSGARVYNLTQTQASQTQARLIYNGVRLSRSWCSSVRCLGLYSILGRRYCTNILHCTAFLHCTCAPLVVVSTINMYTRISLPLVDMHAPYSRHRRFVWSMMSIRSKLSASGGVVGARPACLYVHRIHVCF